MLDIVKIEQKHENVFDNFDVVQKALGKLLEMHFHFSQCNSVAYVLFIYLARQISIKENLELCNIILFSLRLCVSYCEFHGTL